MSDTNIPDNRFSWLGKGVPPEGTIIPSSDAAPILKEIQPPEKVTGQDGLGIIRWLMGTDEERKTGLSGCPMFDNFIVFNAQEEN